jgi:hypothetical protein
MATIFGALGINDSERIFNSTVGQKAIYDLIQSQLAMHNADLQSATRVFVDGQTQDFTHRFKLPGNGRMQRRGSQGTPGAIKANGGWDVAYPLEDFAAQIVGNDVDMAYLTAADLDRHVKAVQEADINTRRFEILYALFHSTTRTFVDNTRQGASLTIQTLANGDSVVYPPVLGSESEATENHYLESGYAASGISDTNNPYATISDELEEHFGAPTGGSNIAVFINSAQTAKTRALTDFVPITDLGISPGDTKDTVNAIPDKLAAGSWRLLGRMDGSGVWVVEWRFIPTGWALGVHLDAPAPLMERVDPADTGLTSGLQLVAQDEEFPFSASFWRDRFGYAVGNRLNGVAFEYGTGGTYTEPTAYA